MITDPESCFSCGAKLTRDEIGMYRKAVKKDAEECLCLECLSAKFGVKRAFFEEKIEFLKKQGCTLFTS